MLCNPGYANRYMPQPAHGTTFSRASSEIRTRDPFLTMEVLYH